VQIGIRWRLNWPRKSSSIPLSATAHLHPCPPEILPPIRKAKRQRPRKHARIAVKLDTIMGVAREMGRLIRLSYNGHLPADELTRYIFALDKLRACLESAVAIEAQAAANAPKPPPGAMTVNILTVPSGTFIDEEMMQRLNEKADSFPRRPLIEHVQPPEPVAEAVQSELASEMGPIEHRAPTEPEAPAPAPKPVLVHEAEPDPLRRRARELGFELLPRRCQVE
jgi:hypothetical protein